MTTRTAQSNGLALVTKAQAKAVVKETMAGINGLLAQSQKFDLKKVDHHGPADDFKFTPSGKLQY